MEIYEEPSAFAYICKGIMYSFQYDARMVEVAHGLEPLLDSNAASDHIIS